MKAIQMLRKARFLEEHPAWRPVDYDRCPAGWLAFQDEYAAMTAPEIPRSGKHGKH